MKNVIVYNRVGTQEQITPKSDADKVRDILEKQENEKLSEKIMSNIYKRTK